LTEDSSPQYIRQTIEELEANLSDGWPCWAIGNHDVQRVATRWNKVDKQNANPAQVKMLNAMLASLRGSICSYQGEELGLVEAEIAYEQLQDPYGIAFWPKFKGRDGCRTPMPWDNETPQGGFTNSEAPWLPVVDSQKSFAVSTQESDEQSMLSSYRQFIHWRKTIPELMYGDIEFIHATDDILVFARKYQGESIIACFNFAENKQVLELPNNGQYQPLSGHGFDVVDLKGMKFELAAYQAAFFKNN